MILIVESGATKTDWCLVDAGRPVRRMQTPGMNLSSISSVGLSPLRRVTRRRSFKLPWRIPIRCRAMSLWRRRSNQAVPG